MGPVIQLCSRCGFDIPADADVCPECGPDDRAEPSRAARQVAGPRPAHPLGAPRCPHTAPRRERARPAEVAPGRSAPAPRSPTPGCSWSSRWSARCSAGLARLDRYVSSPPQRHRRVVRRPHRDGHRSGSVIGAGRRAGGDGRVVHPAGRHRDHAAASATASSSSRAQSHLLGSVAGGRVERAPAPRPRPAPPRRPARLSGRAKRSR